MSSLRDIANALDLSVSMVSKVLSGRMGTSGAPAETVRAIRAKAAELNYHKNVSAAALAAGKSHTVGILIHYLSRIGDLPTREEIVAGQFGIASSSLVEHVISGICDGLIAHQMRTVLGFFSTPATFERLLPCCNRSELDGIIAVDANEQLMQELLEHNSDGLPIVAVHERRNYPELPRVSCDQPAVGELATRQLLEAGCRRIMYIGHFQDRYDGYCRAHAAAGFEVNPALVFRERIYYRHQALELWERLGSEFPGQIDGVVAQSDELALGTLQFLQRNGFRVPQQIRIIGVDNSPFCGLLETPLSSVDQNIYEVGLTASRQLMKLIRGEEIGNVLIAPTLAVRASSSNSSDITIKS